jgi:hypothetical protein
LVSVRFDAAFRRWWVELIVIKHGFEGHFYGTWLWNWCTGSSLVTY